MENHELIVVSRGGKAFFNIKTKELFFHGFILLNSEYDELKVYLGEKYIGNAQLNVNRWDVYKKYPEYGEKTGYRFTQVIEENLTDFYNEDVKIEILYDGKIIRTKDIKLTPALYGFTERKFKFMSYSQYMEDIMLYHPLQAILDRGGSAGIFWVDVGANDPWKNSVTKAFSVMGGSGINIEPLKDKNIFLNFDRPNDINVCAGIFSENGSMKMYSAGGRTTGDIKEMEVLKREGFEEKIFETPVYKLTDVLDKYILPSQQIHFLKIDVEGLERDVLIGLDLNKYRPYIITVEATLPGTNISCADKYEDVVFDNNYSLALDDGINRYYVRNENIELKKFFLTAKELKEIYEIYKPQLM